MQEAHEKGTPVMRTLFYEFPEDQQAWNVEDEYMYGSRILVAPILEAGAKRRAIYLPDENTIWEDCETKEQIQGGTWIQKETTLETMPVYVRCEKHSV